MREKNIKERIISVLASNYIYVKHSCKTILPPKQRFSQTFCLMVALLTTIFLFHATLS